MHGDDYESENRKYEGAGQYGGLRDVISVNRDNWMMMRKKK
jgi:hypothetical protein